MVGSFFDRRRKHWLLYVLGMLVCWGMAGVVAFLLMWCFEFPCAYAFTLLQISKAVSANGVPVASILGSRSIHWHTSSYYNNVCGVDGDLVALRLETLSISNYFAYDTATHVLVPMTDAAARQFPALMPLGDTMINVSLLESNANKRGAAYAMTFVGGDEIKLPEKWFRKHCASGGRISR